jgi:hypothetical protein
MPVPNRHGEEGGRFFVTSALSAMDGSLLVPSPSLGNTAAKLEEIAESRDGSLSWGAGRLHGARNPQSLNHQYHYSRMKNEIKPAGKEELRQIYRRPPASAGYSIIENSCCCRLRPNYKHIGRELIKQSVGCRRPGWIA